MFKQFLKINFIFKIFMFNYLKFYLKFKILFKILNRLNTTKLHTIVQRIPMLMRIIKKIKVTF